MTQSNIEIQARFWDHESQAFDAIYSHRKTALANLLDQVFRRDMYDRFRFAMDHSQPIANRTVLDLGCGSGRYAFAFAKAGSPPGARGRYRAADARTGAGIGCRARGGRSLRIPEHRRVGPGSR